MRFWYKNLFISAFITILAYLMDFYHLTNYNYSNLEIVFVNLFIWILLNQHDFEIRGMKGKKK